MDSLIFWAILLGVAALLEQIFKAARKAQRSGEAPEEAEPGSEAGTRASRLPRDIEDLISEELGTDLERRPRLEERPAGVTLEEREEDPYNPIRGRSEQEESRGPRSPSERESRVRRPASEGRARGRGVPAGSGHPAVRPTRPGARTRPMPEPVEITPAGPVISLEEQGMMERGEAISLERARTPEDHEQFHRRYLERPVEPIAKVSRRRGARLPDRRSWSAVHRAIVWSEIIGPPKGL